MNDLRRIQGVDNKQVGRYGVNDNLRGPDFQHFGCFVDPRHVLKHSFCSGLNKIWLSHHRRK